MEEMGMGAWFREYYLLAVGGAIWSTPVQGMLDFPAQTFIRFFDNHGLLSVNGQPQWLTVAGGSREYVARLAAPFKERITLARGAVRIRRHAQGLSVEDAQGGVMEYDEAVLACHSDQALALLADATQEEREILGAFRYQENRMVLHSDIRFMPRARGAWASWVYLSEARKDDSPGVSLSYWMNSLQPLATRTPILVTLNPAREPDPALVHDACVFEHPVFDTRAIATQPRLDAIQGVNRLWFCGAYQRYGFHEDGLASAVNVAEKMGIAPPWS
jgi:predicted NAD/FAD-binding protein